MHQVKGANPFALTILSLWCSPANMPASPAGDRGLPINLQRGTLATHSGLQQGKPEAHKQAPGSCTPMGLATKRVFGLFRKEIAKPMMHPKPKDSHILSFIYPKLAFDAFRWLFPLNKPIKARWVICWKHQRIIERYSMSMILEKGKASPAEQEKLIEEIEKLIKDKKLECKLEVSEAVRKRGLVLSGCSTCTICPCMICW